MDSRTGLLAGRRRTEIAATLLLVILTAWLANGRVQGSGDTLVSSLIPITLITKGGLQLEDFDTAATQQRGGRRPYAFRDGQHGVVSKYPIATGLLATPVPLFPDRPGGLVGTRPSLLRRDMPLACALGAASAIAFFACFEYWWAGWCVGPRYLTEAEPLLLLLFG